MEIDFYIEEPEEYKPTTAESIRKDYFDYFSKKSLGKTINLKETEHHNVISKSYLIEWLEGEHKLPEKLRGEFYRFKLEPYSNMEYYKLANSSNKAISELMYRVILQKPNHEFDLDCTFIAQGLKNPYQPISSYSLSAMKDIRSSIKNLPDLHIVIDALIEILLNSKPDSIEKISENLISLIKLYIDYNNYHSLKLKHSPDMDMMWKQCAELLTKSSYTVPVYVFNYYQISVPISLSTLMDTLPTLLSVKDLSYISPSYVNYIFQNQSKINMETIHSAMMNLLGNTLNDQSIKLLYLILNSVDFNLVFKPFIIDILKQIHNYFSVYQDELKENFIKVIESNFRNIIECVGISKPLVEYLWSDPEFYISRWDCNLFATESDYNQWFDTLYQLFHKFKRYSSLNSLLMYSNFISVKELSSDIKLIITYDDNPCLPYLWYKKTKNLNMDEPTKNYLHTLITDYKSKSIQTFPFYVQYFIKSLNKDLFYSEVGAFLQKLLSTDSPDAIFTLMKLLLKLKKAGLLVVINLKIQLVIKKLLGRYLYSSQEDKDQLLEYVYRYFVSYFPLNAEQFVIGYIRNFNLSEAKMDILYRLLCKLVSFTSSSVSFLNLAKRCFMWFKPYQIIDKLRLFSTLVPERIMKCTLKEMEDGFSIPTYPIWFYNPSPMSIQLPILVIKYIVSFLLNDNNTNYMWKLNSLAKVSKSVFRMVSYYCQSTFRSMYLQKNNVPKKVTLGSPYCLFSEPAMELNWFHIDTMYNHKDIERVLQRTQTLVFPDSYSFSFIDVESTDNIIKNLTSLKKVKILIHTKKHPQFHKFLVDLVRRSPVKLDIDLWANYNFWIFLIQDLLPHKDKINSIYLRHAHNMIYLNFYIEGLQVLSTIRNTQISFHIKSYIHHQSHSNIINDDRLQFFSNVNSIRGVKILAPLTVYTGLISLSIAKFSKISNLHGFLRSTKTLEILAFEDFIFEEMSNHKEIVDSISENQTLKSLTFNFKKIPKNLDIDKIYFNRNLFRGYINQIQTCHPKLKIKWNSALL
ncbi:hypothetical protein DLAC_00525 [Tieghemostelium lacteum]|uniref:Uncharacterized protein n=1 Tax=Tieghemostelium lacteum TaxID=361077 RepID=A0A152AA75_TIELA|nr:hypothetical protein DLAC_00525 [Tieghemostelium lacteum]|eukprot:KYR03035.1 hypothetical protein DLAC_00525 [Tieghemostelium lacteum]